MIGLAFARRAVAVALNWFNDCVWFVTYLPSWSLYRRLVGGHWERFHVDSRLGSFDIWLQPSGWNTCGHRSCQSGALPPMATKWLECEDFEKLAKANESEPSGR